MIQWLAEIGQGGRVAARLTAPEMGYDDFGRLAVKAPTKELRRAMESAQGWAILGQKHLDHCKNLRNAYAKWAKGKK